MQKKLYKISITCLSLFAILLVIRVINLIQNKNELIENSYSNDYVIDKKDNLSMMLETDYDSNEYELATSSEWPTDGYIFNAELSACKKGSKVSWDSDTNRVVVYAGSVDSCYIYFDKEPDVIYLADYIKNEVYTGVDGENDLYYHDGIGSYTNANQEAGDNSYRYAGSNPNNYVCFGSDDATCAVDNLYRIIGVFGSQVKLIKHDFATITQLGTNGDYVNTYVGEGYPVEIYKGELDPELIGLYSWNTANYNASYNATGYYNVWSYSQLNTVNLNTNYINYLDGINSKWSNMIETHTWIVGGADYNNAYTSGAKTAYTYEIENPSTNAGSATYSAKIGLMYVSDYYYSASPTYWNYPITSSDANDYSLATDNNYLHMGINDWTITRRSDTTEFAYRTYYTGDGNHTRGVLGNDGVRPTFYLSSNVAYVEGDGSRQSPYRISME